MIIFINCWVSIPLKSGHIVTGEKYIYDVGRIYVSIPLKSGHIVTAHKIGLLKQFYEKLQKIFFLKISQK